MAGIEYYRQRLWVLLGDEQKSVFPAELLDEGLRQALSGYSRAAGQAARLAGLDGAVSDDVPEVDLAWLLRGAAGFAAQARAGSPSFSAVHAAEPAEAQSLAAYGRWLLDDFELGLDALRLREMANKGGMPYGAWLWEG